MSNKDKYFDRIFNEIRDEVILKFPEIPISYAWCPLANQEHDQSSRQYCHVYHFAPPRICFARDTINLNKAQIRGLIWHEVGHIIDENKAQTKEEEINKIIYDQFGVIIRYGDDGVQYAED